MTRNLGPVHVAVVAASIVLAAAGAGRADDAPTSTVVAPEVSIAGEPLEAVLPRLSATYGITLSAVPELGGQRVTLFLKDASAEVVARGLRELLSAGSEGPVSWRRVAEGSWRLEESPERRKLIEQLRDADVEFYRKFLEAQVEWARREGPQEVAAAARSPRLPGLEKRLTRALLLDAMGEDGRRRLLAGTPVVLKLDQLPVDLRARVVDQEGLSRVPEAVRNGYSFIYVFGRHPYTPRGSRLFVTRAPSERMVDVHGSQWEVPYARVLPAAYGPFELHPSSDPGGRKVSFNLTPAGPSPASKTVLRNLDQVLQVLARECGLNVIADGYLRPPLEIPANFQVTDYPLKSLLDRFCGIWGCRWRFLDADEKTLVVRSEYWWMDDASEVPEPALREFRKSLGAGRLPELADLLRLAELSEPQIHRLVEAGICTAADGIVHQGWYEPDVGARPWLRFYSRLPEGLQTRVQSAEGLPMKDAPPALVETFLTIPLLTEFRAAGPEGWADLVFSLTVQPDRGVQVEVRRSEGKTWGELVPRFAYFSRRIHQAALMPP